MTFFNYILYRLERVPVSNDDYKNELNIIRSYRFKNNFNLNTINKNHRYQ